jgi:pantoate--beta-alanine ligase
MKVVSRVEDIREVVKQAKLAGKRIGLVPTMGYLHEGHATLMRQAKKEQDFVVASIFVNPLQFGPNEDYAVYPRDLERDCKIAENAGIDIIFAPAVEEMYSGGHSLTHIDVDRITDRLCGAARPGHFRGVATVVAKLFNIVAPNVAYFGQKDAQQVAVIRRMVKDLNFDIAIAAVPIVREADGLAMSSRNTYLNPAERKAALVLNQSLQLAEARLKAGETDAGKIINLIKTKINEEPLAVIDYISISDPGTIEEKSAINGPALIALAVRIGKTRLIDNLLWEA